MAQQTIVAHFDNRADAEKAMEQIVREGVSRNSIQILPDAQNSGYKRSEGSSSYDRERDEGGFWSSLGNLFLPDEDRYTYAEGMSRGGVTMTVMADSSKAERVADIAERCGAVDLDEREQSWRNEGWTGYSSGTTDATSASSTAGLSGTAEGMALGGTGMTTARTGSTAGGAMGASTGSSAMGRDARDEEVIPVVEEQLRVGKRQVEGGRVRVRSYVVETPVEEQVHLREEHVDISRRPVDRPVTAADESMFRERTIEAEERVEEAVVSKEARVTEELVVRKEAEERTETVRDTVRRTEVDIEDDRAAGRSSTSGAGSRRDPF